VRSTLVWIEDITELKHLQSDTLCTRKQSVTLCMLMAAIGFINIIRFDLLWHKVRERSSLCLPVPRTRTVFWRLHVPAVITSQLSQANSRERFSITAGHDAGPIIQPVRRNDVDDKP